MQLLFFRLVIKLLLTPIGITLILHLAIVVLYLIGKMRIIKFLVGFAIVWFFIISTPILPNYLLLKLENKYTPVTIQSIKTELNSSKDSLINILILGGGFETDNRLSFTSQLSSNSLSRLAEGIRLNRLLGRSNLIFSGFRDIQPISNAYASKLAAQELGIDSTIIKTLNEPWNTKAEVIEYLHRFGKTGKLYLVTDAVHMPRAMMLFQSSGLQPIAAPTNFYIKINNIPKRYLDYFPSSLNIHYMEMVFNEYLGMLWVKMGGN